MTRDLLKERLPLLITAHVLGLLALAGELRFDNFLTPRVLANLVVDNAFLGVVAVGLTFVILTGGIDLSVGSMVGLSSILVAKLIAGQTPPALAIGLALGVGAALGYAQGSLISRFRLPPFLVTLAGLFLARGAALMISRESIQIEHPGVKALVDWSLPLPGKASLTAPAVIFFAVLIAGIVAARQSRFGRTIYAIGGAETSAQLMGLAVRATLVRAYVLSGVCGALGGVLFALYTSSGNAVGSPGLELDAIAAVVIGGTLLSGGYGSIFGTFLGLLIVGLVQTAISFEGTLSSWWLRIVIGGLLLTFMLIQRGIELAARRER